jgi:hypothetical protein
MKKWSVYGKIIELSDYDYYDQWIGIIMVTGNLGGILSGFFDLHDKNGNLLEKHAKYLRENINLVEDKVFNALLNELESEFKEIMNLDQEAVVTLAQVLSMETPKIEKEYRSLYKKYEREGHFINANGLLSHPAFEELRQRFLKNTGKIASIKEKLIEHILATFPDVARSEYLQNRYSRGTLE